MTTETKISLAKNTKLSQELKVLEVLLAALEGKVSHPEWIKDGWVNKQYFVRYLYLTQAGRAIHNLEKMLANSTGDTIEHSTFTDEFGFKSYRLITRQTLF